MARVYGFTEEELRDSLKTVLDNGPKSTQFEEDRRKEKLRSDIESIADFLMVSAVRNGRTEEK